MSTFKLQNRIEVTVSVITGMVVTDDDHLLLCDHHSSKESVTRFNSDVVVCNSLSA
jgi:hypothetical protein